MSDIAWRYRIKPKEGEIVVEEDLDAIKFLLENIKAKATVAEISLANNQIFANIICNEEFNEPLKMRNREFVIELIEDKSIGGTEPKLREVDAPSPHFLGVIIHGLDPRLIEDFIRFLNASLAIDLDPSYYSEEGGNCTLFRYLGVDLIRIGIPDPLLAELLMEESSLKYKSSTVRFVSLEENFHPILVSGFSEDFNEFGKFIEFVSIVAMDVEMEAVPIEIERKLDHRTELKAFLTASSREEELIQILGAGISFKGMSLEFEMEEEVNIVGLNYSSEVEASNAALIPQDENSESILISISDGASTTVSDTNFSHVSHENLVLLKPMFEFDFATQREDMLDMLGSLPSFSSYEYFERAKVVVARYDDSTKTEARIRHGLYLTIDMKFNAMRELCATFYIVPEVGAVFPSEENIKKRISERFMPTSASICGLSIPIGICVEVAREKISREDDSDHSFPGVYIYTVTASVVEAESFMADCAEIYPSCKCTATRPMILYVEDFPTGTTEASFFGVIFDAESDVAAIHSVDIDSSSRFARVCVIDSPTVYKELSEAFLERKKKRIRSNSIQNDIYPVKEFLSDAGKNTISTNDIVTLTPIGPFDWNVHARALEGYLASLNINKTEFFKEYGVIVSRCQQSSTYSDLLGKYGLTGKIINADDVTFEVGRELKARIYLLPTAPIAAISGSSDGDQSLLQSISEIAEEVSTVLTSVCGETIANVLNISPASIEMVSGVWQIETTIPVAERLLSTDLFSGLELKFAPFCGTLFLSDLPSEFTKDDNIEAILKFTGKAPYALEYESEHNFAEILMTDRSAYSKMKSQRRIPLSDKGYDISGLEDGLEDGFDDGSGTPQSIVVTESPVYCVKITNLPDEVQNVETFLEFVKGTVYYDEFREQIVDIKKCDDDHILFVSTLDLHERFIKDRILYSRSLCRTSEYVRDDDYFGDRWYTQLLKRRLEMTSVIPEKIFRKKFNPIRWLKFYSRRQSIGSEIEYSDLEKNLRVTVMISTVGLCRRGRYTKGRTEVVLKEPGTTETILRLDGEIGDLPRKEAAVSVIEDDPLAVAEQSARKGAKILLLNATSSPTAGGNFRIGGSGDEEELLRRSNCYRTLTDFDSGVGGGAGVDRYEPGWYPIYSTGVTVFRHSSRKGYELMENPYTVDVITFSALKWPRLNMGGLTDGDILIMKRKIELIFRIALIRGCDTLVLTAFGCGADRNPPEDIAQVYKMVLFEYATFFKDIRIVIHRQDDPNDEEREIYKIFRNIVEGAKSQLKERMVYPVGEMEQYFKKTGDLSMPVCKFGVTCQRAATDANHAETELHPPFCAMLTKGMSECEYFSDKYHKISYKHVLSCEDEGKCAKLRDPKHLLYFTHPGECQYGVLCKDMSEEHNRKFTHQELCKEGMTCQLINDPEHASKFRHVAKLCPRGADCMEFLHDIRHLDRFSHPYVTPCKSFGHCSRVRLQDPDHFERFSHVCEYGTACKNLGDEEHCKHYLHLPQRKCLAENCRDFSEKHLRLYAHKGVPAFRRMCENGEKCDKRKVTEHVRLFRHVEECAPVSDFQELNKECDLEENVKTMKDELVSPFYRYAEDRQSHAMRKSERESQKFAYNLRPVHRCTEDIFSSVLAHGMLLSLEQMEQLNAIRNVRTEILSNDAVKAICDAENMPEVILDYARLKIEVDHARKTEAEVSKDDVSALEQMKTTCDRLRLCRHVEKLNTLIPKLVDACLNLKNSPSGIKLEKDRRIGTHRHIFAVLGPHRGNYGKVFLILRRDIKYHPDFNFTPVAGTSYISGRGRATRPYHKEMDFHKNKLNFAVKGTDDILGVDMCLRLEKEFSFRAIKSYWNSKNSHQVPEAHLPSRVPLGYVEKILCPISFQIEPDTQKRLDDLGIAVERKDIGECISTMWKTLENDDIQEVSRLKGLTLTVSGFSKLLKRLPLNLPEGAEKHVYFRVKGEHFFLTFTSEDEKETVTIYLNNGPKSTNEACYISSVHPMAHNFVKKKLSEMASAYNKEMNSGLYCEDFVEYHVAIVDGTMTVEHVGVSFVFSNQTMEVSEIPPNLKFISISCLDAVLAIQDFYTCEREDKKWKFDPKSGLNTAKSDKVGAKGRYLGGRNSGFSLRILKEKAKPQPKLKPRCQFGANCKHWIKDDPTSKEHNQRLSHPCRFGKGCSSLGDTRHCELFEHVEKPDCRHGGNCSDVHPDHLESYFHQGSPQFLIPCRDKKSCKLNGNTDHLRKFKH